SQKAYAACVADVAPCLKALLDQASGLDKENQQRQWERIKFLMTDDFTTSKALGWIDGERMKKDYELVQTYLGMEKPFDVNTAFSTKLFDPAIRAVGGLCNAARISLARSAVDIGLPGMSVIESWRCTSGFSSALLMAVLIFST